MRAGAKADWVVSMPAGGEARARLFCFPHAGGSHVAFAGWRERLPAWIDLVSFCYPGRLRLVREAPLADLPSLVAGVREAIAPLIDAPFAFFGHSLGALVAFELTRLLRRTNAPRPSAIVVAGHGAPQLPRRTPDLHHLSAGRLLAELAALEGLPPGVAESQELRALVMPAIRADLRAHETYVYRDEPPLACAILALAGRSDPQAAPDEMPGWARQTRGEFSLAAFPGGHFFTVSARDELLDLVGARLPEWLGAAARRQSVPIGD